MDPVLLSRIQFGITIGFHFLFAPLTIGLSWLVFWMMTLYKRLGDQESRQVARFWVKIFALSFAVGVATGVVNEFQFGTNWAAYSRFVGDIFGAPLAAETLSAFFLEAVFLGVLLFGWDKVSPRVHWFSSLMVAVGATLSAVWILIANSWMQTPAGYAMQDGHAVLVDFWAATLNPSTIPRIFHTVSGALVTGAFFMMAISAWFLLKKRHVEMARATLLLSLVIGFAASVGQLATGHYHAQQVARTQPIKLAAFEGLFETQANAPLMLLGVIDEKHETVRYAIRLPGGLSVLAFNHFRSTVRGLKDFPRSEWPPLAWTFYPFHLMIIFGMFNIAFTALGLLLRWRKKLYNNPLYLTMAMLVVPLPFLANELGWITAEVGRQPWIVYQVMRTHDAISVNVPASHIWMSLIMFSLLYTLLFVYWAAFLRRELRLGPENIEAKKTGEEMP